MLPFSGKEPRRGEAGLDYRGTINFDLLEDTYFNDLPIMIESVMDKVMGTGFLGGFTTFSTFQIENAALLRKGSYGTLVVYVALSAILCISVAFLGFWMGS